MYLRDGRLLIEHAFRHGYAVPAFNCCSAEMVRACIEAAAELEAPVIVQTYPTDLEQVPPRQMAALVEAFALEVAVPVVLHLDHGPSSRYAQECLASGFGSVMLDGAGRALPSLLEEVAALSAKTAASAAALEVAADSFDQGRRSRSAPGDVSRLSEAGADMVAVSVGSEHGRVARLDLGLLSRIGRQARAPLVLHGGSGISAPDCRAAAELGVVKVNIGSALYRTLRDVWAKSAGASSHREVYRKARESLKAVARERLARTGAAGRAAGLTLD